MNSTRPGRVGGRLTAPRLGLLLLLAAGAWLWPGLAAALEDDGMSRQRADIAAQRQSVQRRFDDQARDCQQRFVVTACLNAAQKDRRESLVPLRQEEIRIDTLQRKQRAAARLEEIEAKQRADAAKEGAAASAAAGRAGAGEGRAPPGPVGPRPVAPIVDTKPRMPIGDEERQRREAASMLRYEANQEAAEKRREAADVRNAKRAASGKSVRPLPPPEGAASAP